MTELLRGYLELSFGNRNSPPSVSLRRLRPGLLADFLASPDDTHTPKPLGMQLAGLGRKEG